MTIPASVNTAERAIRLGLSDAGLLAEGDNPTSEQFAVGLGRLNDIINLWQTQGLKLWLQEDISVPLVQGQGSYTFKSGGDIDMTKPMRVVDSGYYLDSSANRRPITAISRDEYNKLSNTTNQGPINSYWADKQQLQLVINFWLVPDAETALGTAHIIVQKQVTNAVSLTDTMNFPSEWFIALRWAYADEVCTGQPRDVVMRCANKANAYRIMLEDWDVEDVSTSFQPDPRYTSSSRFR